MNDPQYHITKTVSVVDGDCDRAVKACMSILLQRFCDDLLSGKPMGHAEISNQPLYDSGVPNQAFWYIPMIVSVIADVERTEIKIDMTIINHTLPH